MHLQHLKYTVMLAYLTVVAAGAILFGVATTPEWFALATVALIPAGAMMLLWKDATPTLSESIQAARR